MSIFGCLFGLVFAFLLLLLWFPALLLSLVSWLLGGAKPKRRSRSTSQEQSQGKSEEKKPSFFNDDEGEYVDYEEVK